MTRVLCLTSWFPPHHYGGYELSCHDVMGRLTERGHHVEVLTSDHRHAGVAEPDSPVVAAVHRDLSLYFRDAALWSPSVRERFRVEKANQAALRRALRDCRPDVVSIWHVGAMSLGLITTLMRSGVPLVFAVSDEWPAYVRQLDPWTRAMARVGPFAGLIGAVTRLPTKVPDLDQAGPFCFISELTRRRCRRSSPWTFPNSTIVYSGIDLRLFRPDGRTDRQREVNGGGPRLLYVGRVDERKGLRTIVRALRELPDATLVVDGRAEEPDLRSLDGWATEAGVSDRVTVQCSTREDLPAVYRSADVCVFASEWEEPFGLVPLEAMACGTPVVATGVGGSGEFLVGEGNSLLFPAGDPSALAAAVRRASTDAGLREHIVANGFHTADFFDADHLADSFEAWHAAMAEPGSPRPADRHPPRPPSP